MWSGCPSTCNIVALDRRRNSLGASILRRSTRVHFEDMNQIGVVFMEIWDLLLMGFSLQFKKNQKKSIFGPATKTALSNPLWQPSPFQRPSVQETPFEASPPRNWDLTSGDDAKSCSGNCGDDDGLPFSLAVADPWGIWQGHLGEKGIFLDFNWFRAGKFGIMNPKVSWQPGQHRHLIICERMDLRKFAIFPHHPQTGTESLPPLVQDMPCCSISCQGGACGEIRAAQWGLNGSYI